MKHIILFAYLLFAVQIGTAQEVWNACNSTVSQVPAPSYDSTFVLEAPSRAALQKGMANWVPASSGGWSSDTVICENDYHIQAAHDVTIEANSDILITASSTQITNSMGVGGDLSVTGTINNSNLTTALSAIPVITSGFYTPTATNLSNVAAVTFPTGLYYYRIGNIVTIVGNLTIDKTTTSLGYFDIPFPDGLSGYTTYLSGSINCTSGVAGLHYVYGAGSAIRVDNYISNSTELYYNLVVVYKI